MAKKIRTNKKHRVCRFTGCEHILSVYNPETYCHVHQQIDMARQMSSPLPAGRKD